MTSSTLSPAPDPTLPYVNLFCTVPALSHATVIPFQSMASACNPTTARPVSVVPVPMPLSVPLRPSATPVTVNL